ncbi:hypothetical protein HHK36_009107 [Tetracentron sinense]|uniref:EDRF1 N-terminal domain-containing protein n=1 Tax=Tetracentron sinense TaxID=13715 RepID=A0A834ZCE8_TETSI|nr:hypothetical protein HHK36_009107 [Tetracentron sinense]
MAKAVKKLQYSHSLEKRSPVIHLSRDSRLFPPLLYLIPSPTHSRLLPPFCEALCSSNLARKCEALAVSGLVEYRDEIDVVAPAEILKQIFKMPYSKARLSIAGGDGSRKKGLDHRAEYPEVNLDNFFWGSKQNKRNNSRDAVKKASQVGEKPRFSMQESENDLLLFSNEKYVAVTLHLWDVAQQVTPLTWHEAWLDNVMASVPELAICYHENGVVQGHELLKTDDIFLLKGVSEDGTPAFHPQVVHQNGLSVLRFLQGNCKQDPGSYWLYKSAREDGIQLFDISVHPKNSDNHDNSSSSLPSPIHKGRSDSLFSLGTLLYHVAHRLSLSMAPNSRAKCARLFKKCLDFLDEQDHLDVHAFVHEQFARLILKCYEELELTFKPIPIESEVTVTDAEDESSDFLLDISGSIDCDKVSSQVAEKLLAPGGAELGDAEQTLPSSSGEDCLVVCQMSATPAHVVKTVADPISSKLAAIHHISQAIKSLGWKRQLQNNEEELIDHGNRTEDRPSSIHTYVCVCGDGDCIEVCDIREWLPRSKMDHKLWKLVLLLGESYLALGQAYLEDGQSHQTLKVVELACSVYGSMPQHLEDAQFISSMVYSSSSQTKLNDRSKKTRSFPDDTTKSDCSTYLYWANVWTLVGDVYVEYHMLKTAISYYDKVKKALGGLSTGSTELQTVFRKKGWVCNELGRNRLERKELEKAEFAFADAIIAFKEVSDHTNIILINCNLGHGRRALAEEMVSKIENIKTHAVFQNAYNQALETAKLEYSESLKYYGAAKSELNAVGEGAGSVPSSLRNQVYTQFAHTYLRLGMLLAKEDIPAEVYENGAVVDFSVAYINPHVEDADDSLLVFQILESALSRLLEGRYVSGGPIADSLSNDDAKVHAKFWSQLQILLKRMLVVAPSGSTNKSSVEPQSTLTNNRSADIGKLKELYRMLLKPIDLSQLDAMYELWTS